VRDHLDRAGQQHRDGGFRRFADFVPALHTQSAIHLQVELDEGAVAGIAGAQVVDGPRALTVEGDLFYPLPVLRRQFAVEQLLQRQALNTM